MNKIKKLLLAASLATIVSVGTYYYFSIPRGPIYEYNEARDTQLILDLFKKNWYWLVSSADYSPEFMLKHRAPSKNPLYIGRLKIKVLYEQDDFVGFAAYYMKTKDIGFVLFLAIQDELRSKGYGRLLMQHALDELAKMGAKKIRLVTRPTNVSAQKVYKVVGFYETSRDEEFVYFEYMVKN